MSSPPVGSDEWKAQNKGPAILAVCWLSTLLSTLFVLARVYLSCVIKGKFRSDDLFIIVGQLCGYLAVAFATVAVLNGNGRHMDVLTLEEKSGAILWTTVGFVPGLLSFGLPKLAVVSLLTRLLNPSRLHKIFLWWLVLWCLASVIVTGILLLVRCTPANSLWDFSVPGTCFDVQYLINFGLYAGAFSAFVDVYLAIYPAFILFNLQLSLKKKLALTAALGIGSISGIVAIYKTTRVPSIGSMDFSYDTSDLVLWTVIEGSAIIIAASIPVLQPLLEAILKRNPFSSNKVTSQKLNSNGYDNLSDLRDGGGGSRGHKGGHTYELGQRKAAPKKLDNLGFTVVDDNSQEDILVPGARDISYSANASKSPPSRADEGSADAVRDRAIIRTDEVNVSYSNIR